MLRRFGDAWGLQGVGDVAGFPLFVAVFSAFMFAATPITNTMIRTQEIEADRFGLNLAREPHGAGRGGPEADGIPQARSEPLEEFVFFDHPSTRFRIHDAMRWREAIGTP